MLVGSDDGGIDKDLLKVGIGSKGGEQVLPNASIGPAGKAFVGGVPVPELGR